MSDETANSLRLRLSACRIRRRTLFEQWRILEAQREAMAVRIANMDVEIRDVKDELAARLGLNGEI